MSAGLVVIRRKTCRWLWAALLIVLAAAALVDLHGGRVEPAGVSGPTVSGRTIVIDAGHGGRDPGAVGPGGLQEKDVVLAIARHLALLVRSSGGKAVMTRNEDIDLSQLNPGEGTLKRREMDYRVRVANESGADLLVTIHANGARSSAWRGAQVFYCDKQDPRSRLLAELIQDELARRTNTNRKASPRIEQYLLENVHMPAVNVEVGFITNPTEARLLATTEYQQSVAFAIYSGIVRYLSQSYRPFTSST